MAKYQAEKRALRKARKKPAQIHGTLNGYVNYGCRCGPCGEAKSEYYLQHRNLLKGKDIDRLQPDTDRNPGGPIRLHDLDEGRDEPSSEKFSGGAGGA